MKGISLSNSKNLTNLGACKSRYMVVSRSMLTISGSILLCGIAILVALLLIWRSERKKAAVGRRYLIQTQRCEPSADAVDYAGKCSCSSSDTSSSRYVRSSPLGASPLMVESGWCVFTSLSFEETGLTLDPGLYCSPSWRNRGDSLGPSHECSRRLPTAR